MGGLREVAGRLYRSETTYDFMGHRRLWYAFSAVVVALSIGALTLLGLNFSVEFRGGVELRVARAACSIDQARQAAEATGLGGDLRVQTVGDFVRVQTGQLEVDDGIRVRQAIAQACNVPETAVSTNSVGPSWGRDISTRALQGLVLFLLLVVIFLSLYFEWKMAMAALLALLHDLVVTVGIYALVGFEVSPSTVIGLLTVLGYSLYDTVVVFDKVKENTAGLKAGRRSTYSEAANLAVNQTLIRSINTSVVSLLPVAAIFFVGAQLLGAGTLKDLSLVLLVGLAAGAYSSIFIATPFLASLKEREPEMQALAKRVAQARAAGKLVPATPAGSTASTLRPGGAAFADDEAEADDDAAGSVPAPAGTNRSQPRRTTASQRRPPGKRPR